MHYSEAIEKGLILGRERAEEILQEFLGTKASWRIWSAIGHAERAEMLSEEAQRQFSEIGLWREDVSYEEQLANLLPILTYVPVAIARAESIY